MTETELNKRLAVLLEHSKGTPSCWRRTGLRYRRRKGQEKSGRRLAIIQTARCGPHRGYVDGCFEGRTLLHTGKHIKYPKNSRCQRWLKRGSSKKVRACPYLPQKLYHHLLETEGAAQDLLDGMMPGTAMEAGATEELKARDPMRWVGLMNCCKAQVEEIIFAEIIYC